MKKSKSQLSFEDQAPAMSVAVAEAPVEMTWVDLITPTCQALFLGVIAGFTARVGMTMHLDAWTVSGIVAALTTGGVFVAMASRVR